MRSLRRRRLKPEALQWRLGTRADSDRVVDAGARFRRGVAIDDARFIRLPGLTIYDLVLLPVDRARDFFAHLTLRAPLDEATDLLLAEIRARLRFLADVGLGYLTLDRQSRTLSGGEVQRINLTTALGTSLVNTLFVLDEPSIGLHPRDMGRVIGVMQRLRDAGNSLVVVEHDPQVMLAADRVLDLGPGPGERGGEIVYFGSPRELVSGARTLTADYLAGRKRAGEPVRAVTPAQRRAHRNPRRHRAQSEGHRRRDTAARPCLHHRRVGFRQSTLVQDVLHAALLRAKGKPIETPGAHRGLSGAELIDDVVLVDQAPIGRTTRSNPASYVGAFDAIASASPRRRWRASATTHRARSASTRARDAVRRAAATASSTSRCSSSPTSTCAVPTATASAIAPRCSRSRSKAGRSPTCSK